MNPLPNTQNTNDLVQFSLGHNGAEEACWAHNLLKIHSSRKTSKTQQPQRIFKKHRKKRLRGLSLLADKEYIYVPPTHTRIYIYCNGPLPRACSSASSTVLFVRPSLFGDGPVLTGAFPFLSVSHFPDGIGTIKRQTMSIYFIEQSKARTDDDDIPKRLPGYLPTATYTCKQLIPYSASDLHVQFFIR
ncbi:hypothetical protein T12_16483 [Trichinella patagoniensis]|uniref:Uncharacterized protein n=1 Tax=Trichinella patagoniensis TaxID=990121 RepID=A0A0V0ZU18_9BILA|nr:hypothetical protein T12_16483 [Trichinella patagoniensis]